MIDIRRNPATPNTFSVASFTDANRRYIVTMPASWAMWHTQATCTCKQHAERQIVCKHIAAVVQRVCISAPMAAEIAQAWARNVSDAHFVNKHGEIMNASHFLFSPGWTVLHPPPTVADYIAAQIDTAEEIRLRAGVIYDISGAVLAVDVNDESAITRTHDRIGERNAGIVVYRHRHEPQKRHVHHVGFVWA